MPDIPEHILRRSAEARAKAEGRTVEEVLAEMKGEEPPAGSAAEPEEAPAAGAPTPAAPPPAPPQAGRGGGAALPEALLRRSAEARARAEGRPVEEVLAEMKGDRGVAEPSAPAEQPAAQQPAASQPAAEAPAAEAPTAEAPAAQPAAEAPAQPAGGGDDRYKELEEAGIPQVLIERSKRAMAKAKGEPVGAGAGAQGGGESAPARAATAAAPATAPAAPAVPEGVRTQRLLTVVKAKAIQQVKTEPTDKVNTWPHLVAIEFVALLVVTAAITVFSIWVDAPLLEFANFNEQPNPSKAPWYFLGLQELLGYFDPQVAGVLIPGLGLGALAIIPYIDRNPSVRPADRKLAIMIFSFFIFAAAVLTIYGSFFRGPGFNFTFPWTDGLFFDF